MDRNNLNKSFLITSFLLQYPNKDWMENLLEVYKEAQELKEKASGKLLLRFLEYCRKSKELDLAENYVHTFDFTKKTNLYLTYYKYKEDMKRGEELLKLKKIYRETGVSLIEGELPDFLPVLLEFTAVSGKKDLLLSYIDAVRNILENLAKENNPYVHVIEAVLLLLQESSEGALEKLEVSGGVME